MIRPKYGGSMIGLIEPSNIGFSCPHIGVRMESHLGQVSCGYDFGD